jgi:rhodanese-related sulfurtransferase
MDPKALEQYFAMKLAAEWGPFDLKRHLDAKDPDILVVDTRENEYFRGQHIPGAVNIPTKEINGRWQEIPKDKTVVLYCWSLTCRLASRAALELARRGYSVKELTGGIEAWKKANFPIEKEETAVA